MGRKLKEMNDCSMGVDLFIEKYTEPLLIVMRRLSSFPRKPCLKSWRTAQIKRGRKVLHLALKLLHLRGLLVNSASILSLSKKLLQQSLVKDSENIQMGWNGSRSFSRCRLRPDSGAVEQL